MRFCFYVLVIIFMSSGISQAQELSTATTTEFDHTLMNLREGVYALEEKNKEMRLKINNMPDQINLFREKLKSLQAQAQDLIVQLKNIEKKEEKKRQILSDHEKVLSALYEQIKLVERDHPKLNNEIKSYNNQQQKIVLEKKQLQEKIREMEQTLSFDIQAHFDQQVMKKKLELTKELSLMHVQLKELLDQFEQRKLDAVKPYMKRDSLLEEQQYLKAELNRIRSESVDTVDLKESEITLSSVEQQKLMLVRQEVEELEKDRASLENDLNFEIDLLSALQGQSLDIGPEPELDPLPQLARAPQSFEPITASNKVMTAEEKKLKKSVEVLQNKQDMLYSEYESLRQQMVDMDKERIRLERLVNAYKKMGY